MQLPEQPPEQLPVHLPEQPPEQPLEQEEHPFPLEEPPEFPPEQLPEHDPEQLPLHEPEQDHESLGEFGSSRSQEIRLGPITAKAKIGKVVFAAFLKKERRLYSLFLSIIYDKILIIESILFGIISMSMNLESGNSIT